MYAIVSLWFCVKTPQYLTGGVALLDFRMRSLIARPNSANLDVWILIATNKVTESFCGNFPDSTLQLTSYRYLTSDKKLFDHSDFKSTITRSGWNLRLSVRNMGKSAAMHRRFLFGRRSRMTTVASSSKSTPFKIWSMIAAAAGTPFLRSWLCPKEEKALSFSWV